MDETLKDPAEALLRTYSASGGINYLDAAATLPSRPAIDDAIRLSGGRGNGLQLLGIDSGADAGRLGPQARCLTLGVGRVRAKARLSGR